MHFWIIRASWLMYYGRRLHKGYSINKVKVSRWLFMIWKSQRRMAVTTTFKSICINVLSGKAPSYIPTWRINFFSFRSKYDRLLQTALPLILINSFIYSSWYYSKSSIMSSAQKDYTSKAWTWTCCQGTYMLLTEAAYLLMLTSSYEICIYI